MDRKKLKDLEHKIRLMIKEHPDTMIKVNHADFLALAKHLGKTTRVDVELKKSYFDFEGRRVYVL